MIDFIDHWKEFRALPYSDEILLIGGGMLLIYGILKIVKSSMTMLFWVGLSAIGLTGISQGLDSNPFVTTVAQHSPVGDYLNNGIDSGKEISADALDVLCRKMEETELLQLERKLN